MALSAFDNRFNVFDLFFNDTSIFNTNTLGRCGLKRDFPTDLCDTETETIVTCELPGVNKEDISITIEDGYLVISAQKKRETKLTTTSERSYGKVTRSFFLKDLYDNSQITANLTNGILCVRLPKTQQTKTVQTIEIQ